MSLITDYDFVKPESPDAKQVINFLDEMHFITLTIGKCKTDRNLKKKHFLNKRAILAYGLKTVFLSENRNDLCDRLKLLIQEKRSR